MKKLEGDKIVAASEMARIEQESFDEGNSSGKYMLKAAENLAEAIDSYRKANGEEKVFTLLAGKGNNGGDGYATSVILLKKGYRIKAFYLYDSKECSPLNKKHFESFLKLGGEAVKFEKKEDFSPIGAFIVDALLATGFYGKTEGALSEIIDLANVSAIPILSIDIPSGLQGDTGEIQGSVITAYKTFYLGLPKSGFFLGRGYDKVGLLQKIDFGLDQKFIDRALAFGYLFAQETVKELLPAIRRTQHKYDRGYVVALAGSKGMSGAALLACLAAFRSGAGIVRLFYPTEMEGDLAGAFKELIKTPLGDQLSIEAQRANSLLIGPGIGKSIEAQKHIIDLLASVDKPCVIDADALTVFATQVKKHPKITVLTPHREEMRRCLEVDKTIEEEDFLERCQGFVEDRQVTLILKGAPTFIFESKKPILVIPRGDPGMATAGSGDALTGIVSALLAKGLLGREAAALAVYLHARAGELAAKEKTSYSVMASDIINKLPDVFEEIQVSVFTPKMSSGLSDS